MVLSLFQTSLTAVSALANRQIVSVACGKDFTLAVDNNGKVMAWGQNDSGQLALKTTQPMKEPEVRPSSSRIFPGNRSQSMTGRS